MHDGSIHLDTTEILDIDTMTFSQGPVMCFARSYCVIISLHGSVLVVGGYDGNVHMNTMYVFSLELMTFAAGSTMLTERSGCAAFAPPQDHSPRHALVAGGRIMRSSLSSTEVLTAVG